MGIASRSKRATSSVSVSATPKTLRFAGRAVFMAGPRNESVETRPADYRLTPRGEIACRETAGRSRFRADVRSGRSLGEQRGGQADALTLAAADSGIGSYRANERVKDPAPCDSERKSIA